MNGLTNTYNGLQEHNSGGKNGCIPMEPDSTVNFFNHANQTRMYHPCHHDTHSQYSSYYSERHIVEGLKHSLPCKTEITHPESPVKFHPLESPSKPHHHLNNGGATPISPHQPSPYHEGSGKLQDIESSFNAVHHHPTYHNNNQAWPVQSDFQPEHHPSLHPNHIDPPHRETRYPPMGSFGYQHGNPSTYHETHFSQHVSHVNNPVYSENYNLQH